MARVESLEAEAEAAAEEAATPFLVNADVAALTSIVLGVMILLRELFVEAFAAAPS